MFADGAQGAQPTRSELNQLQAYWDSKRRSDGGLPGRANIDPLEMRFALGHLVLADVEQGVSPRFRLRLVGSHVVERVGFDPTGHYVDTIALAQWPARILPAYHRVLETAAPVHHAVDEVFDKRYIRGEILRLPLASDGKRIDMVLSALYLGC